MSGPRIHGRDAIVNKESSNTPAPAMVRRAVIDVGTNSVKLLVADVGGGDILPVLEDGEQTRLGGEGFYETHRLQPKAIIKTARAVALYAKQARQLDAAHVRVIATSAAREAVNAGELLAAVQRASGLKAEIITGEQEAQWGFRGVTSAPELAHEPLLLLDVGGGSTEFILGQGKQMHLVQSFKIGALRLLELLPHSTSPSEQELAECRKWIRDFLEREVRPRLGPALKNEMRLDSKHRRVQLIGTGGTAAILARIELQLNRWKRARIEAARLELATVREQVELLWGMSLTKRKKVVGLPPKRADVILPGVAIYEAVMEAFGFSMLRVSTRGLRFAAVMD
jgi:exopolyphosphatase/guanosine-5'-triphosphate,3'-diphosphate pyrophosphatase